MTGRELVNKLSFQSGFGLIVRNILLSCWRSELVIKAPHYIRERERERFLRNKTLIIKLQLGRTGREFVYSRAIIRNKRSFRSQLVIRETGKIAVPVLLQTSPDWPLIGPSLLT